MLTISCPQCCMATANEQFTNFEKLESGQLQAVTKYACSNCLFEFHRMSGKPKSHFDEAIEEVVTSSWSPYENFRARGKTKRGWLSRWGGGGRRRGSVVVVRSSVEDGPSWTERNRKRTTASLKDICSVKKSTCEEDKYVVEEINLEISDDK